MIETDKRKKKFIRVKPPCYDIQVLLLTRLNEWRAGQNQQITNQRSEREKERLEEAMHEQLKSWSASKNH
jgi:hypothetical protein